MSTNRIYYHDKPTIIAIDGDGVQCELITFNHKNDAPGKPPSSLRHDHIRPAFVCDLVDHGLLVDLRLSVWISNQKSHHPPTDRPVHPSTYRPYILRPQFETDSGIRVPIAGISAIVDCFGKVEIVDGDSRSNYFGVVVCAGPASRSVHAARGFLAASSYHSSQPSSSLTLSRLSSSELYLHCKDILVPQVHAAMELEEK